LLKCPHATRPRERHQRSLSKQILALRATLASSVPGDTATPADTAAQAGSETPVAGAMPYRQGNKVGGLRRLYYSTHICPCFRDAKDRRRGVEAVRVCQVMKRRGHAVVNVKVRVVEEGPVDKRPRIDDVGCDLQVGRARAAQVPFKPSVVPGAGLDLGPCSARYYNPIGHRCVVASTIQDRSTAATTAAHTAAFVSMTTA